MRKVIKIIKDPFGVIIEKKSEFFIWFLFTIITGQFGMLANIIVRYYANDTGVIKSIYIDSINGSFYTFSIALVASLLGPIFINFVNSKKLKFTTLKTFTIIISIFYLFVAGIIYASIQSKSSSQFTQTEFNVDITQLVTYVFAIFFASYCFCILGMENSSINFSLLDDPLFSDEDDKNVNDRIEEANELSKDPTGINL